MGIRVRDTTIPLIISFLVLVHQRRRRRITCMDTDRDPPGTGTGATNRGTTLRMVIGVECTLRHRHHPLHQPADTIILPLLASIPDPVDRSLLKRITSIPLRRDMANDSWWTLLGMETELPAIHLNEEE